MAVPATHAGVSCPGSILPLIALEYMFGTLNLIRRVTGKNRSTPKPASFSIAAWALTFFTPPNVVSHKMLQKQWVVYKYSWVH
jgi:hypothetical protein